MTTGELVARIREDRGILQKDLAKAIQMDPVVLNRIEKNKRPIRGDELLAIAKYFKVSADYLLDNKENSSRVFSDEEERLISNYRKLDVFKKQTLLSMLAFLISPQGATA